MIMTWGVKWGYHHFRKHPKKPTMDPEPRLLDLRLTSILCRRLLRGLHEFLDFGLAGLQLAWLNQHRFTTRNVAGRWEDFGPKPKDSTVGDFFVKKTDWSHREKGGKRDGLFFPPKKKLKKKVEVVEVDKDFSVEDCFFKTGKDYLWINGNISGGQLFIVVASQEKMEDLTNNIK